MEQVFDQKFSGGNMHSQGLDKDSVSEAPARMKVAIISTYDDLCGIAGYTRAMVEQLKPYADVEVMDLDQYLLRSPHARVQKLAEKHIREIADRLKEFDAVNMQFEYGTLGRSPSQIIRRFKRLARAAPALSVTFHTILSEDSGDWRSVWPLIKKGRLIAAFEAIATSRRGRALSTAAYGTLRTLQWRKPVSVIVHTRRDQRLLHDVWRIADVSHHPLSFLAPERSDAIRASVSRSSFPILDRIPADAKLIGTFGFLSPYKGFETALQALNYLPSNYHLLIFGGIHPQAIQREVPRDPYISHLLGVANVGRTMFEGRVGDPPPNVAVHMTMAPGSTHALLSRHPKDLEGRVHFMGVLGDDEFAGAMAICDTVVMPYMEVGQSASGPISIAMEMGCRIVASRTAAFMQYSRYHPDQMEFFDIGNFLELAERLSASPPKDPKARIGQLKFNVTTNAELYMRSFSGGLARFAGHVLASGKVSK